MNKQELENQYLTIGEITFTPRYKYIEIEIENEDGEILKDFDYTITATAQEVYQEWLAQQNATPQQTIEERITQLEVLQVNSMSLQIQNQILGGQI